MYKAVVIGEREKILPFKALGMGLEYAGSRKDIERVFEKLARDPAVSLIIVSEDIVVEQPDIVSTFRQRMRVPIVVLPTHLGSAGASARETGKMVKDAVGVDILGGGLY